MRKQLLCSIVCLLGVPELADAESCKLAYWEVLKSSGQCEQFELPDFSFRSRPTPPNDPLSRFCSQYEIVSKSGTQQVGYCYTGEGDRTGPVFKVGGRQFLADLNFEGCSNGKKLAGVVFVPDGWKSAPKGLKRLWPVRSLPEKVSCEELPR